MAKKKKTQLKPVARGFTTTSLPKKIVEDTLPENTVTTSSQPSSSCTPTTANDIEPNEGPLNTAAAKSLDKVSLEEQSLQNLVDKLQDKTEKEISRTLKSIEVDRRFSQTLPPLDIDPVLRDRIMASALDTLEPEGQRFSDDSEEKATARLGVTYGILRRLGFSENRVDECIRNISGIDLDEALDWLYLHCSEDELKPCSPEVAEAKAQKISIAVTGRNHFTSPATPRLQTEYSQQGTFLDDKTPPPDPKEYDGNDSIITAANIPSSIKSRILASYGSKDEDDEEPDQGDPNVIYTGLRLRKDEVALKMQSQETVFQLRQLQKEIDAVTQDYLFDEKEAMARYRLERNKLDKFILQERLQSPSSETNPNVRSKKSKPVRAPSPPPLDKKDIFDDSDSDDSSTGMLGLLDAEGATDIVVKGVIFTLRNMEIPKHWSGPVPKTLLRDFVAKADRYAAISYTTVSNHSRARRATVIISWQNRKRDEWKMDHVACPNDSQAEQYIAAIALHSLTYPLTEGFAASSPISASNSTSFRLLPVVYRDLWDELEASRKAKYDLINRTIWSKLQKLVADKMENNSKLPGKQQKEIVDKQLSDALHVSVENKDEALDILALSYNARRMTPAYQQMITRRNDLPIAQYRDRIMGILERCQVLVLSGETGCGKSTQVPAFILEDQLAKGKHCKIYCTEPRRISAISLAQRVSYELCDPPNSVGTTNSLVGYSIRLESNISRNTRLAFVTNGIALRMLEGGSGQGGHGTAFDEITHLIIDEVHERTIESDFLLIVLKSLLTERSDLKVILMSATVDAEKISSYFGNCETLHVPGRTFPVNIQFLEDAIEYSKWTLAENSPYARRSHDKYYKGKNREWTEDALGVDDDDDDSDQNQTVKLEKRYSPETAITLNTIDERLIPYELIIRLLEMICYEDQEYLTFSPATLIFMPGLGEIRRLNDLLVEHRVFGSNNFKIYPLHSTLSSESQGAVFDIPPVGVRKIVIATNIAETGITIPDITCVIDTGKHREMRFDEKRQISRLVETFIARSNAAQRRGRAGRVQNGLCFHLFTKMRHDTQMADSPLPEMMRLSLSDLALRIKIMKIKLGSSIEDVLSRAMDPPVAINVQRAVSMLVEVRALTSTEDITPMGRLLSKLPTDVHLGKFLLIATTFRCLDPALTIAATLNSKSPFVAPFGLEQDSERAKNSFRIENSDFLTIHNAFSSWRRACANPGVARKFCRTNFLSHQNLQQIEDLRQQFLGYLIDSSFVQVDRSIVRELSRARHVRNRTRFMAIPSELDVNSNNPLLVNAALAAGLYPKILSIDSKNGQMRTITNNQQVFFHPSSINFGRNVTDFGANHLAYFTLMHSKRLYAWETGPVDDLGMLLLCGETDFKLISDMVWIDRKIKFSIAPKTAIALKILREQLTTLLAQQYQGKLLTPSQAAWMELGLLALGRIKLKVEKEEILLAVR